MSIGSDGQQPRLRRFPSLPFELLAAVLLCGAPLLAQQPVPPLNARVTDLTNTLSESARTELEQKLAAFEVRKGAQIVVLLVPTVVPESIEQYSLRVAEAWQIGRGAVDDGIVIVIAKDDRRLRIEVGYGLEGAVPDALAKRIIADRLVPRFYENDYAGGLEDGVDALIGLIDGEPLPPPSSAPSPSFEIFPALPLLLLVAVILAPLFRRIFGALVGSLVVGGGAGLIVWVISSVLFAAIAAGAIVFLLALAGIAGPRGGPGRWSSGGSWGGGGFRGGGLGGGGGFGGGGGRFGGGGASGGW